MPKHWVGAAALLACIAGSAIAQEADQGAAGVTLTAEQIATPHTVSVSIGARPGYRRIEGCSGHFPEGVTYELNYQAAPGASLVAAARSTADTTLYIEGPGGLRVCDDDSMDFDPRIELSNAPSGLYRLWVGTYSGTQRAGTANLVLTTDSDWPPSGLRHEAEPRDDAVGLTAGFWPDPHLVRDIDVGGALSIDLRNNDACYGLTEAAPNVRLRFRTGLRATQLVIDLDSPVDGTLAVRTPGGAWVCDDDGGVGLNPRVVLRPAETGEYAIYAGSLEDAAQGVLRISESMPIVPPDLAATPSVRALSLAADFRSQTLAVSAGGPVDASVAVDDALGRCVGHMSIAPLVGLTIAEGGPSGVTLRANAEADTTLVVHRDGRWLCDDDGGPAYHPALRIDGLSAADALLIYVGRYENASAAPANLIISRD